MKNILSRNEGTSTGLELSAQRSTDKKGAGSIYQSERRKHINGALSGSSPGMLRNINSGQFIVQQRGSVSTAEAGSCALGLSRLRSGGSIMLNPAQQAENTQRLILSSVAEGATN